MSRAVEGEEEKEGAANVEVTEEVELGGGFKLIPIKETKRLIS